jgi:beta-lactamase superfamily II metal-dependent hydrolase
MTLKIFVHDVGHGHSIHAFTPNGQVVVVDLGCSSQFSPLEWLRKKTNTIDSLIISHPHGDHIDEIERLSAHGFTVRQLWRPRWLTEEDVRKANQKTYAQKLDTYFEMNNQYTGLIASGTLVGDPAVSGGVCIQQFASRECGTSNINNHSGVIVFTYQGVKVIIPGDNEPPSWKALLELPEFVSAIDGAHVFLASHHGRESGYHSELFKCMKPKLCLVSDGRVQDTDATSRYSGHAAGWNVRSRSDNSSVQRSCLTTRSDGTIVMKVGANALNKNSFLAVSTC